ncbi:MAG TPA: hypothetical protein EYN43_07025 [Gammaproteobacteria bacterium]|nr:hypothetical protein [Gammaproteobacteria bacterium]
MAYGVTQQMIDTYGEIIFKLSLNKQTRIGDPVRELDFDEIAQQRAGSGLTDEEIAARIGLLPEQVGVVRVFVERKYYRIDQHRMLFHLGGGQALEERPVPGSQGETEDPGRWHGIACGFDFQP